MFGKVECFDYSHPFVNMMQTKIEESDLRGKMVGYQADAHNLLASVKQPDPLGKFDLVFNCNLIDRLHTPVDFVNQGCNSILLLIAERRNYSRQQ